MMRVGLFSAFLLFFSDRISSAHAAEPIELEWGTDCPTGYNKCADLEFCQSGSTFGYRLPTTTECGLLTAPLIRMKKGQKYLLNLYNKASEPANLHTHGLHVSGDGNADDPTREAHPNGGCLSYTYDIPNHHRGGTLWYHSHIHGMTARHVEGGALGMLIVEDDLADLPNDEAVQTFAMNPLYELNLIAVVLSRSTVYANGRLTPEIFDELLPGEWYRLRLVAAEPAAKLLDVVVVGCQAHAVAYDGVWRSQVPGPSAPFQLTGASRMDLAIQCFGSGSMEIESNTVAHFEVLGGDVPLQPPSSPFFGGSGTWNSRDGMASTHYLADLSTVTPDRTFDISNSGSTINGQSWDPSTPHAYMTAEDVQEWTISGSNAHPFHLHVYHMQVVSVGGCDHHEEGEYYDTISSSGSCKVKFRMADFGGQVVFHCHVLRHEDNGAMAWVSVDDGGLVAPVDTSNMDICSVTTGGGSGGGGGDGGSTSTCSAAGVSCAKDSDCCSMLCSGGKPQTRVCQ
jgi:FtsP/CotA-like multicopper oxidase with cupredoxin domain